MTGKIDQREAMRKTISLAHSLDLDMQSSDSPYSDFEHLLEMQRQAENFVDEEKVGRFLGWMQACVYINSMGEVTLDQLRQINRQCEIEREERIPSGEPGHDW